MQSTVPGVVYAVKRYVMYVCCQLGSSYGGQCNACAALGHHHPMPRYSTRVVALSNSLELFKYVHFIFPLLSSKCLLSLLLSNKLTLPERVSCLLISGPSLPGLPLRPCNNSRLPIKPCSSPAIAPAHSSPPLLFNPPLLSHCKTGLRSPMTRAAHLILCSNSFHPN